MTGCATSMCRSAEVLRAPVLALAALAIAAPLAARDAQETAIGRAPDAQDVAMTPLNDLNLARDELPPVLVAAAADPYANTGLTDCRAIEAAIADLDLTLGPDMDVAQSQADRLSTGRMAKSVVASFIPFRGILRELSGAAEQERTLQAAIYAGAIRRGYLKGLGEQKGCAYPARPAFARVVVAKPSRGSKAAAPAALPTAVAAAEPAPFVSEPVVQPIGRR